jgi:uncharacterized protein (TIGR02147 family)
LKIASKYRKQVITYPSMLKNELQSRQRKNGSYSVSSFARDIGISQPFLTQILSRKRKLGSEKAVLLAERLKLKPTRKKLFLNLVRLELTRDPRSRAILQAEIDNQLRNSPKFSVLSEDTFNVVADWYYFAILELTALKAFKNDPTWISKRINVPVSEVEAAIHRLKRVGLLEEVDGLLRKVEKDYLFENVPSQAIRKHHQQSLNLASSALKNQPMDEREFFTISMPMNPELMGRAKSAIREFSEALMAEMQAAEPKSVYKLCVQFFRLDRERS